MNTRELAAAVARRTGLDLQTARRAVGAIPPIIGDEFRRGGRVRLGNLGTFKTKFVKAGTYRDVRTKEIKTYPASRHLSFDVANSYKKRT